MPAITRPARVKKAISGFSFAGKWGIFKKRVERNGRSVAVFHCFKDTIMPVPKRKRSRARRDKRFANKALQIKTFTSCPNCDEAIMPHQVCLGCGHYKGRKIMATKNDRAVKRVEIRQAKDARKAAAAPQERSE